MVGYTAHSKAENMELTWKLTNTDIDCIWWDVEKKVFMTEIKLLEKSSKDTLASKDEMIKLLKRNEKGLTDRISNYTRNLR